MMNLEPPNASNGKRFYYKGIPEGIRQTFDVYSTLHRPVVEYSREDLRVRCSSKVPKRSAGSPASFVLHLLPMHRLHLSQQRSELAIVHLHAVVEVQADALVGVVAELLVEASKLNLLLAELGEFFL